MFHEAKPNYNLVFKCRQITFKFSVINAKPIGERTLPMEYLKCRAKPDHHTWESWVQFSNEKYLAHQKDFLACKADEEARQKQIENDRIQAENLALQMSKDLLPDLDFDLLNQTLNSNTSSKPEPTSTTTIKVKCEPGFNITDRGVEAPSENGKSEIPKKDEALHMADAICKFIKELSELMIDKDVQYALCQLKFMGQQMLADPTTIQQFNSELSRHCQSEKAHIESGSSAPVAPTTSSAGSSVKHLDFYNPQHPIKVETGDSFSSPRPKSMIPGAKRQSYENFTKQFQKRRRKNAPSPARSHQGLGSPKTVPAASQLNYKAMTPVKIEIINEGIKFLSKNKKPKLAQSLWTELENCQRAVLETPDNNFYFIMSYFDEEFRKIADSAHSKSMKERLFDFILSKLDYTRVSFLSQA